MSKLNKGFSLIELLIAISLITVLAGFAIPSFSEFNRRQILKQAASQIVSDIRTMQNNANSGVGGRIWGITFTTGEDSYYLFKCTELGTGNSCAEDCASPITKVCEDKFFDGNVTASSTGTYIFTSIPGKVYNTADGTPPIPPITSAETITVTDGIDTQTITINAVGNIYED